MRGKRFGENERWKDCPDCNTKEARAGGVTGGGGGQGYFVSRSGYLLYKKIARAIKATVMTHRMMSLLPFFSSAIKEVHHTSIRGSSIVVFFSPSGSYGFDAARLASARL